MPAQGATKMAMGRELSSECTPARTRWRARGHPQPPTQPRELGGVYSIVWMDAHDRMFGEMMDLLEQRGLLDDTTGVYTSDHTANWDVRARTSQFALWSEV